MKSSLISVLFLLGAFAGSAQRNPEGTWEGKLNVGVELRLVFHIDRVNGSLRATADSPDQSAYDLPCDSVYFRNDSLQIIMSALNARYEGVMQNDSLITGTLTQGIPFPVDLKRKAGVTPQNKRPQVPKEPFPYKVENISYFNNDNSIRFGATLTLPIGDGPFPSVVLISGSGAQDRNSNLLGHPLFLVLADHLTRNGIAVLRYDERGVGETTGTFEGATSADFAKDVEAALNYLSGRKEIDHKKTGLIGHSEGGMIAPMVANSRKDVSFVVLLAAPGVPHIDLMTLQNESIARSSGLSEKAVESVPFLFRNVAQLILEAKDPEEAKKKTKTFLQSWIRGKDAGLLAELNLADTSARDNYITAMVDQLRSPWFDYFVRYDPGPPLRKLKGKVLALNGTRDIQVIHSQNLPAIEAALKKGAAKEYTVRALEGLNHLFQTCTDCTLQEYGKISETFSPVALELISNWLTEKIK